MHANPVINLTSQVFGRLIVLRQVSGRLRGSSMWECRCECGNIKITSSNMLRTGHCKSCGCLNLKAQRETHTKHGMHATPTYAAWKDMKRRCLNQNAPNYPGYGGRGIRVCGRWLDSFDNFLADMGVRPYGLTLERENNNGNYEPGNVVWASRDTQANNTRRNRYVTIDGVTKTVSQWAKQVGIHRGAIRHRLDAGWDERAAIFTKSKRAA